MAEGRTGPWPGEWLLGRQGWGWLVGYLLACACSWEGRNGEGPGGGRDGGRSRGLRLVVLCGVEGEVFRLLPRSLAWEFLVGARPSGAGRGELQAVRSGSCRVSVSALRRVTARTMPRIWAARASRCSRQTCSRTRRRLAPGRPGCSTATPTARLAASVVDPKHHRTAPSSRGTGTKGPESPRDDFVLLRRDGRPANRDQQPAAFGSATRTDRTTQRLVAHTAGQTNIACCLNTRRTACTTMKEIIKAALRASPAWSFETSKSLADKFAAWTSWVMLRLGCWHWQAFTYTRTFSERTPGVPSKASMLQSHLMEASGKTVSILALIALPVPTTPMIAFEEHFSTTKGGWRISYPAVASLSVTVKAARSPPEYWGRKSKTFRARPFRTKPRITMPMAALDSRTSKPFEH